MFEKTIKALKAAESAIEEEWKAARGHAPSRGLFENTYPQVVSIRKELEGHAARPEIAAIDQTKEASK